jgi:hypothetical protein
MNVAILWDAVLSNPYVNRRFGRIYRLNIQHRKSANKKPVFRSLGNILPAEHCFLAGLILTLKIEAIGFFETSVYILTTLHYSPENNNIGRCSSEWR